MDYFLLSRECLFTVFTLSAHCPTVAETFPTTAQHIFIHNDLWNPRQAYADLGVTHSANPSLTDIVCTDGIHTTVNELLDDTAHAISTPWFWVLV